MTSPSVRDAPAALAPATAAEGGEQVRPIR